MAKEDAFFWYAGAGAQPENYALGPFNTRDDAIADGRDYYDGQAFTVIEACKGEFSPPSADALMGEWLERWGDDDMGREDYPEFKGPKAAIDAAEADLDQLLSAWFERHRAIMPEPWCFGESRNEELIATAANAEAE